MFPAQMREDLERLKRLPADWDGEDSPKITEQAIESCKRIIAEFEQLENRLIQIGANPIEYPDFLYPGKGGGLSFRWNVDKFNRITILPDGAIVYKTQETK